MGPKLSPRSPSSVSLPGFVAFPGSNVHSPPRDLIACLAFPVVFQVFIGIPTSLLTTLSAISHLYIDHRWKYGRKSIGSWLLHAAGFPKMLVFMPFVKGFRIAFIEYSRAFEAFWQGLPISFVRATRSSVAVVVVQVLIECETGAWSFHHPAYHSFEKLLLKYIPKPRCKRSGWLYHQCSAPLLGFFLTCFIVKTRSFHSDGISVVRTRTYVGWSFLYDMTHPATKDAPFGLQVLHAYRVFITYWNGKWRIIFKVWRWAAFYVHQLAQGQWA